MFFVNIYMYFDACVCIRVNARVYISHCTYAYIQAIAVSVDMTTSHVQPFLFRNFEFPSARRSPFDGTSWAPLWLAGRCCSAGSLYFPAVRLAIGMHFLSPLSPLRYLSLVCVATLPSPLSPLRYLFSSV